MNISIRLEKESDFEKVEHLTREAFWDMYRPGCLEHLIVHQRFPYKEKILQIHSFNKW